MPLSLIYPVLAQVLLTLVVGLAMARVRGRALRNRDVTVGDIALDNRNWPDEARKAANNFSNQFETPVLFYVLCLVATHINAVNWITIALAWLFVVSRAVHAAIHIGGNNVRQRATAYVFGVAMVLGLWLMIVLKLLTRFV